MPKIKTEPSYKPVIDLDTLAHMYHVIIYNCGGTPTLGRHIRAHDCLDSSAIIQHLIVATPNCYEYETYFNGRINLVFKATYPETGENITIELLEN